MSDSKPDPEAVIPDELLAAMEDRSPTVLRAVADYATALAENEVRGQVDDQVRGRTDDGPGGGNDAGTGGRTDDESSARVSGGSTIDDPVGSADDSVKSATDGATAPAFESDSKATGCNPADPRDVDDGERPDGVPGKASITVKEINDNRYYYWQWREGEDVRSKYHGPLDSGS